MLIRFYLEMSIQKFRKWFEPMKDATFVPGGNYIGGGWQPPLSGVWLSVLDPATLQFFSRIPSSNATDVESAIDAASRSFEEGSWSRTTPSARGRVIWQMADIVESRSEELSIIETRDSGKPLREARADIAGVVDTLQYFAGLTSKISGQSIQLPDGQLGLVLREPIGVVGAITPWNFPLYVAVWKVSAALTAGCSIVLKPSELASLTCLMLGEIATAAGVPRGVLNIVTGYGDPVGSTLAQSPRVDMLSFTGSTRTGRQVMKMRSELPGPIQVELGGKSPHIVFNDAEIKQAADAVVYGAFYCQGENCNAGSRLLVHESIHYDFVNRLTEKVERIKIGPTLEAETQFGAIISQGQLEKIEGFVERALNEGTRLAIGGQRAIVAGCENGLFFKPTILVGVERHHEVFQEEVFGPVLTVTSFQDDNDAIELANATDYGLAAGIWTSDLKRAFRCAGQIRSGYVWINTYNSTPVEAPFGGVKRSGFGRDTGIQAIDGYMTLKTVAVASTEFVDWYAN